MISKYVSFPIILLVLIKITATADVSVSELQKLQEENVRLKAEKSRLKEAENLHQRQLKSLNTKVDSLLMNYCARSSKNAELKTTLAPEYPSSCAAALKNGGESGVYKLSIPNSGLKPFDVYCLRDLNLGPAWTVVQRRQDGSVDFYRGWEEYKNGFGNVSGEYFVGLEQLHAMTTSIQPQELWILLEDFYGSVRYAHYEGFVIGVEASKYELTVLGAYSGDAGDSLSYHKGRQFVTKDSLNISGMGPNCAVLAKGAWWFSQCYHSHLNGVYGPNQSHQSITWNSWFRDYPLSYTHMALRPVN